LLLSNRGAAALGFGVRLPAQASIIIVAHTISICAVVLWQGQE
jgi:hypothetical protein